MSRQSILRHIFCRPSSPAQHSSHSSAPFRIPPSTTTNSSTPIITSHTTNSLSRRALSSQLRSQTNQATLRIALACEGSSLRYALLLSGEGEDALIRGWDAGVALVEEDDGT
eukprot:scaffold64_cov193-Alexandrium_tamarense.AAC.3